MSIEVPKLVSSIFSSLMAVSFWQGADDAGAMVREEVGRADNMEAPEKGYKAPEGSHDKSCCLHLPLWRVGRPLVECSAWQGQTINA